MKDRKKILIGLICILCAFLGVLGIFYLMIDAQMKSAANMDALEEEFALVSQEREIAKETADKYERELGQSLYLGRLLEEANKVYDEREKDRKEGHLWIDRKSKTMVVTLGALNGLRPGSQLAVYDQADKIMIVTVETPMDVISYIKPHRRLMDQYEKNYYRVVIEE